MFARAEKAVPARLLVIALLASACGDSTPPETVGTVTAVANTDQQTAVVGTAVPIAPAVLVKSTNGNPLAGVAVTFAVQSGGGTASPATAVTTNASGIASLDRWTLGTAAGANSITATAAGGTAVTITATGIADAPTKITKLNDAQSAPVGTAVPNPPGVALKDQYDNPVANLQVTFEVTAGGGTVVGSPVTTSASGEASVTSWTLGTTAGANTLRVTAAALAPVTLTATAVAGPATALTVVGDNQQATVNTAVATAPGVTVKDQFGNPIANVSVTFAVTLGGGSITGGTATTDAAGLARVGSWTLGKTVGQNRLTATVGSTNIAINATGLVGAAAKIVAVSGDQQSDTVLATLAQPIVSRLTDQFDNPIAGVFVAYTVTAGAGALSAISATTDASGLTHATWKLGAAVGANSVQAALQSGSVPPLVFTAAALAPPFLAAEVAPGVNHTCARRAAPAGGVYCWGANASAELGNSTTVPSSIPVLIAGGIALHGLVSGLDYSCGLDALNRAFCWGANGAGQLGEGTHAGHGTPTAVTGSFIYQQLYAGVATTCGLMVTGDLRCWGDNTNGMFGDGTVNSSAAPAPAGGAFTYKAVAVGDQHVCGITTANVTYCWGNNASGQLGINSTSPSLSAALVAGTQTFVAIGAGTEHTCGINAANQVYCWGKNTKGELGLSAATPQSVIPVQTAFATALAALAVRGHSDCAQTLAVGPAQCWGFNGDGQLNVPATATPEVPQAVQALGAVTFSSVRLGTTFGCSIGSDGALYCWGTNTSGQLGDGTTTNSTGAVRVRGR
jgi:alpha-tubulin suppressor-like RCC1 family protein